MGPHTSSAKHLPWSGARRSTWQAYALAVLATVATVAVRIALTPWVHERPTLILFALPIALSAYVGGLGPGLVCTVLVTLASAFFVLPPTQGLSLSRPEDVAQLGLLAGVGLVLSFMTPQRSGRVP